MECDPHFQWAIHGEIIFYKASEKAILKVGKL